MSLEITVCHHSASLVMPNCDPLDRFFDPTLTLMIDSFITPIQKACANKVVSDQPAPKGHMGTTGSCLKMQC